MSKVLQDRLEELKDQAKRRYQKRMKGAAPATPLDAANTQEQVVAVAVDQVGGVELLGMLYMDPTMMHESIAGYAGGDREIENVEQVLRTVVEQRVWGLLDRDLHPENYAAAPAA